MFGIMILYQVNRTLFKKPIINNFFRYAHHDHGSKILYPLESRNLLKVKGNDAPVFLQGLITNDMRHFEEGADCMYAMFLNNKGKVLYDTLIYRWDCNNSFLVECDKTAKHLLQKHLKIFKLKRLVDIVDVSDEYKIWVLIPSTDLMFNSKVDCKNEVNIYKDPRLTNLGFRVISNSSTKENHIKEIVGTDAVVEKNEEGYKYLRYKLGVSEGANDFPPGTAFPLEINCDYLHGVSFHKGCYIGQELTARVHHTGVVRKRIMPIKFSENVKESIEKDSVILANNNPKSNLGKLKGVIHNYGIGLIRIKEALEANSLNIGAHTVQVLRPSWWPIEAPKEKAALKTE